MNKTTIYCENTNDIFAIKPLMKDYKNAIGEEELTESQFKDLEKAIKEEAIHFFIAKENDEIVAMCSVSKTFSTFSCNYSGVFEDFYIVPEYRHKGVARELTQYVFAWCENNSLNSLWVGSADCDVQMYQSLGFEIPLGNLLTWAI